MGKNNRKTDKRSRSNTTTNQAQNNSQNKAIPESPKSSCTVYFQKVMFRKGKKTNYINLLCQHYYKGIEGIQDWLNNETARIGDSQKVAIPVRLSNQEKSGWVLCNKKEKLYFLPIPSYDSYEKLSEIPPQEPSCEEDQLIRDFNSVLQSLRALKVGDDNMGKGVQAEQYENTEDQTSPDLQEMHEGGTDAPDSGAVTEGIYNDASSSESQSDLRPKVDDSFSAPLQSSLLVGAKEENVSLDLDIIIEKVERMKTNTEELLKQVGDKVEEIKQLQEYKNQSIIKAGEDVTKITNLEGEISKLQTSLTSCEEERDTLKKSLEREQENHKRYNDNLECYDDNVKKWAKNACMMFECLDRMEQGADHFYRQLKAASDIHTDDMNDINYYMLRIQSKYAEAKNSIKNLSKIRQELSTLADLGILPKQGILYPQLQEVSDSPKQEDQLRFYIHKTVVGPLMGAAIIRCDEYALFLPNFVNNIPHEMTKFFAEMSEYIQRVMKGLKYEVVYAAPYKPLNQFNEVNNVKAAPSDLEIPSGTIFEVIKMAINYGNHKEKTEVSASIDTKI